MSGRIAIATTLRDPGPSLGSFLRYHFAIGFDEIFLFFDDPEDPSMELARTFPGVLIIRHDELLRSRWQQTVLFKNHPECHGRIQRTPMMRQSLNLEVALDLAVQRGVRWLLSLDADELFHVGAGDAKAYFGGLSSEGIESVVCLNHEAVSETVHVEDPFTEVTLFKINLLTLPAGGPTRAQLKLAGRMPFTGYNEGKPAVSPRSGVLPLGPHDFIFPEESLQGYRFGRSVVGRLVALATWVAPTCAWTMFRRLVDARQIKASLSRDPVILHYACCGFESFWRKHQHQADQEVFVSRNDAQARKHTDRYRKSHEFAQRRNREEGLQVFRQRHMLSADAVHAGLQAGILQRIVTPQQLLARHVDSEWTQSEPSASERIRQSMSRRLDAVG